METQQTAVEWMIEKLQQGNDLKDVAPFAKDLMKEQIMKAVYDGMKTNIDPSMGRAYEYYNRKYGK